MGRGPLTEVGAAGRVLIPRRFNGPPASANGGYTCGLIARHISGPAEISLRSPPPLDTALALLRDDGRSRLGSATTRCSSPRARPAEPLDVEPPVRPTVAEAREALRRHPWHGTRHAFTAVLHLRLRAARTGSACTSATCRASRR